MKKLLFICDIGDIQECTVRYKDSYDSYKEKRFICMEVGVGNATEEILVEQSMTEKEALDAILAELGEGK